MTHPLVTYCADVVRFLEGKPNVFGSPCEIGQDGATTTCSTFLTMALMRCYSLQRADIIDAFEGTWPRARAFQQAFAAGRPSEPLFKVTDLGPGTMGAIGYDEDQEGMSGHCFIVMERPRSTVYRYGGFAEYIVAVCDSCRTHHGASDSRYLKPGGIGIGPIRLLVDDNDVVQGYTWSLGIESTAKYNGQGQQLSFANPPPDWRLRHG